MEDCVCGRGVRAETLGQRPDTTEELSAKVSRENSHDGEPRPRGMLPQKLITKIHWVALGCGGSAPDC